MSGVFAVLGEREGHQIPVTADFSRWPFRSQTAKPVSYTHLDVYKRQGLVIMDTPGNDPSSVAGMVAGGAQIVVFSTGRGTPTRCV